MENTAKIITNYFFFRFIQMLQPICKNFTKLIVRRVNINVSFKLKDPFIHCSFTQRNSHLFYNKCSSITNLHNKIYPNTKLFRHLLERLQQRFKKKKENGSWQHFQFFAMEIDTDQTAGYIVSRKSRYFI